MTAAISSIQLHFPDRVLTNAELAAAFNTCADSIYRTSGAHSRRIAAATETPSDLAYQAACKLFQTHDAATIDALIFCTQGADYKAPASACLLHHRLDLKPTCLSLDIPGGCTGFVNGLQVAKSLIAGNPNIHQVLLLTAETVSKVLHPDDLQLRMLFGDAACATLITRSPTEKIGQFVAGTDGSRAKALWVEHSATREPADLEWLTQYQHLPNGMAYGRLQMQGAELLHFSLARMPQLIDSTLAANQLTDADIDLYIFHQASKIILTSLQRKCRIPDEKFYLCLEGYGNTVSSSIPLALYQARQEGVVQQGSRVMLIGFGIGLSWNATVIEA